MLPGKDQAEGLRRLMQPQPVRLSVILSEEEVLGAYARIKHLALTRGVREFFIEVRGAANEEEARRAFEHLRRVAGEYLGVTLLYAAPESQA